MMSTLTIFIVFVIVCHSTLALSGGNQGLLEKIKNGLKSMKSYLDTVKGIANLVSNSFKRKSDQKPCNENKYDSGTKKPESGTLASAFFRLLGLDSPKIAAITVNSAIFLAQMIGTLFGINSDYGRSTDGKNKDADDEQLFDPFKFFMESENEQIQELIKQARNPELPHQLIDHIANFDNTACIQLLVCKTAPIIMRAQETLENKTKINRFDLISWIPSKHDFEKNSESCEAKHSNCKVFPEGL